MALLRCQAGRAAAGRHAPLQAAFRLREFAGRLPRSAAISAGESGGLHLPVRARHMHRFAPFFRHMHRFARFFFFLIYRERQGADGPGSEGRLTPIDLGDDCDNIIFTPGDPTKGTSGDLNLFFGGAFGGLLFGPSAVATGASAEGGEGPVTAIRGEGSA